MALRKTKNVIEKCYQKYLIIFFLLRKKDVKKKTSE